MATESLGFNGPVYLKNTIDFYTSQDVTSPAVSDVNRADLQSFADHFRD